MEERREGVRNEERTREYRGNSSEVVVSLVAMVSIW